MKSMKKRKLKKLTEFRGCSRRRSIPVPNPEELEQEIRRVKYKGRYRRAISTSIYILVTAAAVGVLISTLIMPVLKICGTSMNPTLREGAIVAALKNTEIKNGDIIAFHYNNKILTKRVIAKAGSWVNITEDGTVYVDNREVPEPYAAEKTLGNCNINFPYQVPEGRFFVLGDHRSTSVDSRNTAVGCVSEEFVVGKLIFTVWPFSESGVIN